MPSDDPMAAATRLDYRCTRSDGGRVDKGMPVDPHARDALNQAGMVIGSAAAQGATAFIVAADAFFASYRHPDVRLSAAAPPAANGHRDLLAAGLAFTFAAYGIAEPDDPSERMWLHLALLDEMLDR